MVDMTSCLKRLLWSANQANSAFGEGKWVAIHVITGWKPWNGRPELRMDVRSPVAASLAYGL